MRSGLRRLFRPAGPGQPGEEVVRPDETTPDDGAGQQPDPGKQKPPWELDESSGVGEDGRSWDEEVSGSGSGWPAEETVWGSAGDAGADDAATGADVAEAGADEADVAEAGADTAAGAGAEGEAGLEDAAAGVGVESAVSAEAIAPGGAGPAGAGPAGARPRRRWLWSSRLARHARVARIRAAVSASGRRIRAVVSRVPVKASGRRIRAVVSRVQAMASGRTFTRLTLLPVLLVIAWLLPAMPLLLGGSFALAPMLAISIPVALALVYFGLRLVPGRWPMSAQAKPGLGARAPAWTTFCTFAVAAGFTAWQIVMNSHQVIVTRDPGVYLNFGYWIAHHGSVTIPVSATAFGAHHPGLAFASAGFIQNGVNLIPQFLAGLPILLAAGFWSGGTSAAVLVPPVIGGLAVLAFGGLTGRLAGPRWAPAGAIVLALALPEQYTSRTAFSETLTQVLLFGGLCLLIDSLSSPASRMAPVGPSAVVAPADPDSGVVGVDSVSGPASGVASADPGSAGSAVVGVDSVSGPASGDVSADPESGDSGVVGADSEAFITADSDVTGDDSAAAYSASSSAFDPASGDSGDADPAFTSAGAGSAAVDSTGSGSADPGPAGFGSAGSGSAGFEHDPADPDTEALTSVDDPDTKALPSVDSDPAGSGRASPVTALLPAIAAMRMRWRRPSWLVSPGQATILALLAGLALGLTTAIRIDGLSLLLPAVPIVGIMFAGRKPQWLPFGLGLVVGAGYGLADDLLLARPYFDSLSSWTRPFGITIAAVAVITVDCALIWRYAKVGRLAKRVLAIAPLRWLPGVIATLTVLVMIAFAVRPYVQTVRGDTNTGEISYVGYLQRVAGLPLDPRRLYAEDTLYWVIWYIGLPAVLLGVFGFALLTQRVLRSFFTWKDPTGTARLWALPLLIIGWITVTVLWRPGTVPDQPWASRRLVPVVIPGLILVAVWAAAWLTGRASARGAGRTASSAVAVFCLGALLLPTTLTTFGIGVTSSSITKGDSKRLALQPIGLGQIDAVHSVCTTLGPDASVVIVDPRVASQFTQVIRGMCNVPVAAMDHPPPVSLQPVISSIVSAHRRPVLLGADAAELNLFGSSPRRILNLSTTQDAHELTRPPTTAWPIHYTIWMSQVG